MSVGSFQHFYLLTFFLWKFSSSCSLLSPVRSSRISVSPILDNGRPAPNETLVSLTSLFSPMGKWWPRHIVSKIDNVTFPLSPFEILLVWYAKENWTTFISLCNLSNMSHSIKITGLDEYDNFYDVPVRSIDNVYPCHLNNVIDLASMVGLAPTHTADEYEPLPYIAPGFPLFVFYGELV